VNKPPADRPVVSVIVVNFDGLHHLKRCLASLTATRGVAFETIVVDNASRDGSVPFVRDRYPEVRVLPLKSNIGFGQANMHGAGLAGGEYVSFLNNDTEVESDWLVTLLEALKRERDVWAACSLLKLMDRPDTLNAYGGGMTRLGFGFDRCFGMPCRLLEGTSEEKATEEVFFPTAAAMLMRRADLFVVGGFDPSFFIYHEDVDLGWRIRLLGKRVVVCRNSVVYHRYGSTVGKLRHRLGSRHLVRSILKNYEIGNVVRSFCILHAIWLRSLQIDRLLDVWRWNVIHLPGTLRARRAGRKRRVVRDRDLLERGLIDPEDIPEPYPQVSLKTSAWSADNCLSSNVLMPGQDSAIGRLGSGWSAPGILKGEQIRWVGASADCRLRTEPGVCGRLSLIVHPAEDNGSSCKAVIRCNGSHRVFVAAYGEWRGVGLPVRADARGMLEAEIRTFEQNASCTSPTAAEVSMGKPKVAVREIRFEAEGFPHAHEYRAVSVVIPTHNRWPILRDTLSSLVKQTVLPLEIIVVDDGSTDGSAAELTAWQQTADPPFDLKILRQQNAGAAAARNRGIDCASGDLVLFLGDDTIAEEDLVETHLKQHCLSGRHCAVVGFTDWHKGVMRVTPFLRFVNVCGAQFGYGSMRDGCDVPFTCFYTSNLSIARETLSREKFDTVFKGAGWEDLELGYRLSLRGLRIVHCRGARARHVHPMKMADFLRREKRNGTSFCEVIAMHPELALRPGMRSVHGRKRFVRAGRFLFGWAVPLLSAMDGLGVRLPAILYTLLLVWSFQRGVLRGSSRTSRLHDIGERLLRPLEKDESATEANQ